MDAGMDFLGPPMSEAIASSSKVPKPIYFLILRLMPKAERRDQRRAAALFIVVALKRSGRNNALNYAAWAFRELVEKDAIEASGACKLLVEACNANGYLAKDGAEAVRLTIMSGLGLTEWPEEVAQHNPFTAQEMAERIYSNLKQPTEPDQPKRPPPIDGWSPQRAQWGEVDHRARGFMSPLGGKAKGKTP